MLPQTRGLSSVAAAGACALAVTVLVSAQQQPTFRRSADVIAVDVQVVDRAGQPVTDLTPESFEVTIDGKRRRVISADLVDVRSGTPTAAVAAVPDAALPPDAPPPSGAPPGRIIVLAVDASNFPVGGLRAHLMAARTFIERLPPQDLVGLFAYPTGPKIDPSTDRADVIRALDHIVGQRESLTVGIEHHLSWSQLIDLSNLFETVGPPPCNAGEPLPLEVQGICPSVPAGGDSSDCQLCVDRLVKDTKAQVMTIEGQSLASIGMLRSLLANLADVAGRKTVVFVSGGVVQSDRPGGRPDIGDTGIETGRIAAQSNISLYTLFVDSPADAAYTAEARRAVYTGTSVTRDRRLLEQWLDRFSGSAGGSLMRISTGAGELAFDRVLAEMSAYYLLAVEALPTDRDGVAREMKVKVAERNVEVRARKWVTVPKPNATLRLPTPLPGNTTTTTLVRRTTPVHPPTAELGDVESAYFSGNYDRVRTLLAQPDRIESLIRDFRVADRPWPDTPQRASALALEIALAGIRHESRATRDEAVRFLAETHAYVAMPSGGDDNRLECLWYRAEIASLEGVPQPEATTPFVTRAVQRCPNDGRLALARAVIAEQAWPAGPAPGRGRPPTVTNDVLARSITDLYASAIAMPEAATEARVRAAWFQYRLGRVDAARALLDGVSESPVAPHVLYFAGLVGGAVFRASGQIDAAASILRNTVARSEGAQSAQVALMGVLLEQGKSEEAEALATAVQTRTDPPFDPWWLYRLGDYIVYPSLIDQLRAAVR
jgi:VWFA-related protein